MGTLYIVSTPIGNLKDITLRASRILREASLVAAEDTRHSGRLLQHYQIHNRLISLHEHNEEGRISAILPVLDRGEDVALISDAPAHHCSPTRAICLSGRLSPLATPSLRYQAPAPSWRRWSQLPGYQHIDSCSWASHRARPANSGELAQSIGGEPGTLVFYESPGRVRALLVGLCDVLGPERPVVVARESDETPRNAVARRPARGADSICSRPFWERLGCWWEAPAPPLAPGRGGRLRRPASGYWQGA